MSRRSNTDNIATLVGPDEEDITDVLQQRFDKRQYYTYLGDYVIAVNPQSSANEEENSPANGKRYCRKRPLRAQLPPHVYALASDVYRDLVHGDKSHTMFVSGCAGAGKTEISAMLLAQLLRASGIPRTHELPHVLMGGLSLMKRLVTYKSVYGPMSSAASTVVSLYFAEGGKLRTAEVNSYLLNSRHTTPQDNDQGYLNIYYDLVAALHSRDVGISAIVEPQRTLNSLPPSLTRMRRETVLEHSGEWEMVVETVRSLGIGHEIPNGHRNDPSNTFLDYLLALMLLATIKFGLHPQSGQVVVQDRDNFVMATQLLKISDSDLYNALMAESAKFSAPPPYNVTQACHQLVHELHSRLVKWLEAELNSKLPDIIDGYAPVHIAEMPPFDHRPEGSLETLCQNLVAEKLEGFMQHCLFARESDMCEAEGVQVSKLNRNPRCQNVVTLAFSEQPGLLNQVDSLCPRPDISDAAVVSVLDKIFKKSKDVYTPSKKLDTATFAITHSHMQVSYRVTPEFRAQNNIIPIRAAHTLLASSTNELVREIFVPVAAELSDPTRPSHFSYITYMRIQAHKLTEQLRLTVPHFVRCIKPSVQGPEFSPAFVQSQVLAGNLPDVAEQKRFGFSTWMPIPEFLRRYHMVALPMSVSYPETPETCGQVFERAGMLNRGAAVSSRFVFLIYWQKKKLDSLVDDFEVKVTTVQAQVRGYLTRKRLNDDLISRMRSYDQQRLQRLGSGQFGGRASLMTTHMQMKEDELYENIIARTLDRVHDLSTTAWAKVVYLEQDRQLAKVYAGELSLIVTGSRQDFDGIELGLGYFRNQEQLAETQYIKEHLEQGLELHRDSDGNILAKRFCRQPITVKRRGNEGFLSADMVKSQGRLPMGSMVKIFDIQEFRSLLMLHIKNKTLSKQSLQHRCITAVSFGQSDLPLLKMPCWIAVVNILALRLLDDEEELKAMALMTSQLVLNLDEEKEEMKAVQSDAKERTKRKSWSKIDRRPKFNQLKEQNGRRLREELRRRGERISDHMPYSWEEETARAPKINMDQLYEKMRKEGSNPGPLSPHGPRSPGHSWAKIDVALRTATREVRGSDLDMISMDEEPEPVPEPPGYFPSQPVPEPPGYFPSRGPSTRAGSVYDRITSY